MKSLKETQALRMPNELKIEHYERRRFEATFHRLDLAIQFVHGHNDRGAIVKCFIDAIPRHDAAVKHVEEIWCKIDELQSLLKKKNRLFGNLDSAFNAMLTNPDDFSAYLELLPRMQGNVAERIQTITDTEEKVKAEAEVLEVLIPFHF